MNFSFATELEPSLAESFDFFAECCSKLLPNREDDRLLELNERENLQTIVILPPQYKIDDENQVIHDEINNQITLRNSSFVYKLYKKSNSIHSFPRLKIELGISKSSNENLNNTLTSLNNSANVKINENGRNTKNANFSDTQSVSSDNTQTQFSIKPKKSKVLDTPIGVRTRPEMLHSQKVSFERLFFMN